MDFFDDETTFKILKEHGFSEEDAKYVVDWIGGVPWMLERVVLEKNSRKTILDLYDMIKGNIDEMLGSIFEEDERLYDEVVDFLKRLLNEEGTDIRKRDRKRVKSYFTTIPSKVSSDSRPSSMKERRGNCWVQNLN